MIKVDMPGLEEAIGPFKRIASALRSSDSALFYVPGFPNLIHLLNQLINLLLPIPQITPLDKMLELSSPKPPIRVTQLERPQKVARLLEIRSHGINLMNEILHAHNTVLAQMILDDLVVGEGNALLVDLAVAALVDEFTDGLEAGVAVGDVRFHDLEHFGGGFGEADKDAVVDLEETEELEGFAGFGGHFGDTGNCEREYGRAVWWDD